MTPAKSQVPTARKPRKLRHWWIKQLHAWHWVSAAISLAGMLLFAITGITLNHAASISAEPVIAQREGRLSPGALAALEAPADDSPLPTPVAAAVRSQLGLEASGKPAEWSDGEVYLALPRPGGDAWVSIDRASGALTAETTDRGWISYLNDLHKGRNAGDAWFWFIDAFALACVVFTLTGLFLLQVHARHRPSTWPVVLAGIALPFVIALAFIH